MLFSFNESDGKSRRSVWTRIEQTGHLYGIGEQIGIWIWYFQQRHGRISAELLELSDKVRLVSITAGVCYLCLVDFFTRLMLHLRQSLLEADDTGIFLGLMPTNEWNNRSNCFLLRLAMEDNSFTEICGVIYIRCMAASILLILCVVSAKLSAICDT